MNLAELLPTLVAVAIFILVAFPVHEFSHAWAAYRLGDSTARWQGRLTLNPIVHFDPIGGLILIVTALLPGGFVIGWAKPTPVNPYNLRYGRRGESIVALSGPLSNLVMALAIALPMRIIIDSPEMYGSVLSNDITSFAFQTAYQFVQINVILMIFNLLPIAPLDGWRVLIGVLDARTAFNLRQFEQYGFIVLLLIVFFGGSLLGGVINSVMRFLLGL